MDAVGWRREVLAALVIDDFGRMCELLDDTPVYSLPVGLTAVVDRDRARMMDVADNLYIKPGPIPRAFLCGVFFAARTLLHTLPPYELVSLVQYGAVVVRS